jgi:hypothetical protein
MLAALSIVASSQAQAERQFFYDGNSIHESCSTDPRGTTNYVAGVVDAHETLTGGSEPRFCIPPRVTGGQARDVVCKFVAERPHDRHLAASPLIILALKAAFPCQP